MSVSPTAPDEGETRRHRFYPLGRWSPDPGDLHEIAAGVFWLRMPMPFSLDHINLWVLDGGDHWVIGGIGSPWLSASVALVGIVAEVLRAIGRTSIVTFVGHRVFALCLAEYRP